MEKEIFEKVCNIITEVVGVDKSVLTKEALLIEFTDEIDRKEITLCIEEELDIEIPDSETDKWTTVDSVVKYVLENV